MIGSRTSNNPAALPTVLFFFFFLNSDVYIPLQLPLQEQDAAGFRSLYINNKERHGVRDERGAKIRDKLERGNEEMLAGLRRVTSRGSGVTWRRQD